MKVLISGYGDIPNSTMSFIEFREQEPVRSLWQTAIENPSFLCRGDGYIFTVTEAEEYAYVYSFRNAGSGYELVDRKRVEGGALCHITYSSKNKALFGACYGTGTVFALSVKEGCFGTLFHHEIQGSPLTRAHCVRLNQAENQLYTVNIAQDRIIRYSVTPDKLTREGEIRTPKGSGPRHIILSDSEELLYVITEYSNEILVYENCGAFKLLQTISTLSKYFTGTSNCSTLCFSNNRRYLFAANRGADTIALFTVGQDGLLEWCNEYDCGGKHPRHMIVTEDGEHLIVCNQQSDLITVFAVNAETGELTKVTEYEFPAPSGILDLSE